jgi:hypothetical protein
VKRFYCSVMVTLRSLIINRGPVRQKLIGFLRVCFSAKTGGVCAFVYGRSA